HSNWEQSHIPQPSPRSAQKNLAFLRLVRMLESIAAVAHTRRALCTRSPKAVSAKLRGAKIDTNMWTHTTAQTTAVHFLTCWSGEFPTTSNFMFSGTEIRITEVIAGANCCSARWSTERR